LAERSCALQSASYNKLKESFTDKRKAVENLIAGGGIPVWMLGDEVPEEIIIAGGFVPVRLWGQCGPRPNADKYLEVSFGSLWRGFFESAVSGEYAGIKDYLVLSNSSDIIQKLYYYLIQLKKIEPGRKLPEIAYVDYWLVDTGYRAQERNWKETAAFLKTVESWSGNRISDRALADAVRLCNEYKSVLRDFSRLRRCPNSRINGSEAQTVISGSFYLEKKEAIEVIRTLTREAENWPEVRNTGCFYTGSLQETTEVSNLMEDSGLNIISEDKIIGDRYSDIDTDPDLSPIRAISNRYHLRFPSSERSYIKDRAESIPKRVAEVGAKAVVVFMNHNDESYIWDLPRQKAELNKMGIDILTVENQYQPLRNKEKLLETFKNFARSVNKGGKNG